MFTSNVLIGGILCVVLLTKIDAQGPRNDPRFQQLHKECEQELSSKYNFGVGEAAKDLDRLKEHNPPQTEAGKCFMACIFKKNGMIVNGKFIGQADKMPDCPHKEEIVKIMQKCQNEVTNYKDDCDLAGKIGECLHKNKPAVFQNKS